MTIRRKLMTGGLALAALPGLAGTAAAATTTATTATAAAAQQRDTLYVYSGRLVSNPPPGANALTVRVLGGNHPALRTLAGRRTAQAFTVDAGTHYIRWTAGIPTVVTLDDLKAGDRLSVHVRAHRGARLARVTSTPATSIADHGSEAPTPQLPQWEFHGKATAAAANGHVTIRVAGGNTRALRALLGESAEQTFSYAAGTVFLSWSGGLPTVVTPDSVQAGDRVIIRVRAPHGSTLAQVEARPAFRVAEREPVQAPQ